MIGKALVTGAIAMQAVVVGASLPAHSPLRQEAGRGFWDVLACGLCGGAAIGGAIYYGPTLLIAAAATGGAAATAAAGAAVACIHECVEAVQ